MYCSARQAALGLIVAVLAVAALAAQRGDPVAVAPPRASASDIKRRPVPAPARSPWRALADGELLDLNHASAAELTSIPGIGPKLAQRILDERTRRGGFTTIDQLQAIRGIGPKLWDRVRAFAHVTQAKPTDQNKSNRYEADTPALK